MPTLLANMLAENMPTCWFGLPYPRGVELEGAQGAQLSCLAAFIKFINKFIKFRGLAAFVFGR